MKHISFISIFFALSCSLFYCTKQVTRTSETSTAPVVQKSAKPLSFVKKAKRDTLTYIVEFHDTLERGQFGKSMENLIKSFPSTSANDSTKALYIKAQVITPSPGFSERVPVQPTIISPPQKQETVAEKLEHPSARYGGAAVIYSPYAAFDPSLAPLVEALMSRSETCAAKGQDSVPAFCEIRLISEKKISMTLSAIAKNAAGKQLSAFDVVTVWNGYIKQHPAEGHALFRYVNGIDHYIAGREAVVPGFQVNDEKTVTIQLSQPDPQAVQRLCTSRLFPALFKTGPYYIKNEKNNLLQLAPNEYFRLGKPFLNSCEMRLGKDNNPFLAFSMNRYDAMALYSIKDIDYARRMFSDKAILRVFAENRYFLSISLQNADLRGTLCRLFDRRDILANYVKAEGSALPSIETPEENAESSLPSAPILTSIPSSLAASPIVVLFRSDDPIAGVIADKLLADISRAGLSCTVRGVSVEEYEKNLIKRDYGIAVGYVPGTIMQDQSERLRMATLWYSDEAIERKRIDEHYEFPLFSIKTYLLYKNKIGFLNDAIEGMYVKE
jgi:hypothetical protein